MAKEVCIGNVAELRQFGKNLNQASGALSTLFNQLGQQMNRACSTWQDAQAQRFMEQFTQERAEVEKMAERLYAAKLLMEGKTYNQVIAQSDISSATLSRVSRCVQYGNGYSRLLKAE